MKSSYRVNLQTFVHKSDLNYNDVDGVKREKRERQRVETLQNFR